MTKVNIKMAEGKVILTNEEQTAIDVAAYDPSDLLAGALAKCTGIEIAKLAQFKEYKLDDFTVREDLDKDKETKTANFKVHLDLVGDLSEGEIRKLHKAAKKSYNNRLLSNDINLEGDVHHNGKKIEFN